MPGGVLLFMTFAVGPRVLGVGLVCMIVSIAGLAMKVDAQKTTIAALKDQAEVQAHEAKSSLAACEERFRQYRRAEKIQEDRAFCERESHDNRDVSLEGCLDRWAKEWPEP